MRPRSGLTTIRFRLGLAVALALSPVLALGALQSFGEFRRDAQAETVSLTQAAQRSAVVARARVRANVVLLQTISSAAVGPACAPRLSDLLERGSGYVNVIAFDRIGRVRCAAATVPADASRRSADWFERLRAGAPLVVTSAPAGLYGPSPAVLAAVPAVDDKGQFDGALVSLMRLDSLQLQADDPALPSGAQVALTDAASTKKPLTAPLAVAGKPTPPPSVSTRTVHAISPVLVTVSARECHVMMLTSLKSSSLGACSANKPATTLSGARRSRAVDFTSNVACCVPLLSGVTKSAMSTDACASRKSAAPAANSPSNATHGAFDTSW